MAAGAEVEDQTTKEWSAGEATRKAATPAKKKVTRKVSGSLKKT